MSYVFILCTVFACHAFNRGNLFTYLLTYLQYNFCFITFSCIGGIKWCNFACYPDLEVISSLDSSGIVGTDSVVYCYELTRGKGSVLLIDYILNYTNKSKLRSQYDIKRRNANVTSNQIPHNYRR